MFDWNHFFGSIKKYLDYYRVHIKTMPLMNGSTTTMQIISDSELAGLLSWIKFATTISQNNPESRRQIYEDKNWSCIESVVGLLTNPIPLILKGCFYKYLAALAVDEIAAVNIWNCLLCEGICIRHADGKLIGIQQELDEREAQLKNYDCTQGFLTLMRELFKHKTRPGTQQIAPYLQYIVNSILCQFSTRSYNDLKQMWLIVKLAIDSLYEPLKTFYATPSTVENNVIEVQILSQLLSDSPLSRTLLQIIAEGSSRLQDESFSFSQSREEATLSAIRLFYTALSHRIALSDAIRAVNSINIMIVSLESLLFSPIPNVEQKQTNYISILSQYLNEADELIRHKFYIWLILKEATSQRSLQTHIIRSLMSRRSQLILGIASFSILSQEDTAITIIDLPPTNIDSLSRSRVKGEICRLMFEIFNEAVEINPDSANITYFLMNFDLNDLQETRMEMPANQYCITCLHNIIELIIKLAQSEDPFSSPFSGLYEPALRLILRICSTKAAVSSLMLRYFRSQYDLIYRLATSSIFKRLNNLQLTESEISTQNESKQIKNELSIMTVNKSIQGIILELIALDLSSLIKSGHIEQPSRYLKILLSNEYENNRALLWNLIDASRVFVENFHMPQFNKFDIQKVEELLSLCIRKNVCNIDQFDVIYLHLLLNSEINTIMNTEISIIKEEARSILDYCVKKNARNLLEGACTHLLQGWLSLMNVLSIQIPLPFIDIRIHQHILVDALFLLRDYCASVEMSPELAESLAACMARFINSICTILERYEKSTNAQEEILPIICLLLQCIILPGYSKSVPFKTVLYTSCLRAIDLFCRFQSSICNETPQSTKNLVDDFGGDLMNMLFSKTGYDITMRRGDLTILNNNQNQTDPMVKMVRHERIINHLWAQLIEPLTYQIVQIITSDIIFAPMPLKMLATATFIDLMREDSKFGGNIAREIVFNGSLHCIEDTLKRLKNMKPAQENKKRFDSLEKAFNYLINLANSVVRNHAVL